MVRGGGPRQNESQCTDEQGHYKGELLGKMMDDTSGLGMCLYGWWPPYRTKEY